MASQIGVDRHRALYRARGKRFEEITGPRESDSRKQNEALRCPFHEQIKCLLLRPKGWHATYAILALPADLRVATKELAEHVGAKRIRFATLEEFKEVCGVAPGALSPHGSLYGLPLILSERVLDSTTGYIVPGELGRYFRIHAHDLVDMERPTIVPVSCTPRAARGAAT